MSINETILLTGSSGFIASKVAEFLLRDGYTVIGVDNMNDYYDVRLKEERLRVLSEKENYIFYNYDIENIDSMREIFSKHNISKVVNLAARAGVRYSMENPHVYMTTNAHGTLNLLEVMKEHGIKKLVLASTSSLYAGQQMPFNEDLAVNVPISPYAASKKAAEVMAYSYHYLYDMDISVVRYFTVYGPNGRPDMCIFRFIKWIDEGLPIELFGDGSQSRDFTYVDDIAEGTIKAMRDVGYQIINLGGGKNPVSLNYIIEMIENHLGKKAIIENKPFHKADIKETWANIEKAGRILDWTPTISVEDGVKRCVDWHVANREWLKEIRL